MAISPDDVQAVRRALEERREHFSERVELLGRAPEAGASVGYGKRIGDGTTEAISRLTDIGVGRSLETGLERVTRALAKLDEGTYGMCDGCGADIPRERLAAMPESVFCVACAAAAADASVPRR